MMHDDPCLLERNTLYMCMCLTNIYMPNRLDASNNRYECKETWNIKHLSISCIPVRICRTQVNEATQRQRLYRYLLTLGEAPHAICIWKTPLSLLSRPRLTSPPPTLLSSLSSKHTVPSFPTHVYSTPKVIQRISNFPLIPTM